MTVTPTAEMLEVTEETIGRVGASERGDSNASLAQSFATGDGGAHRSASIRGLRVDVAVLLPLILSQFLDNASPLEWSVPTYIAVVVSLLVLHAILPLSGGFGRFARELCLLLPAGLLYFLVRGVIETRVDEAYLSAERLVALEQSHGIFIEARLQREVLNHSILVDLANWVYIWAHWPVILAWAVWIWCRHRGAYFRYRNAFLISGAIGLVIFTLFPVAPPRFLADRGFVDTVAEQSRSYRVLQPPALANQYAAMPSLHFGWDLLVGIALVRYAGRLAVRIIGVLLPVAMFLAIVITANHYVLDGIAGGAVALVGLALAVELERVRRRSDGRTVITGHATPSHNRVLESLRGIKL